MFEGALALSVSLHIAALLASVSIATFPRVVPVSSSDPNPVLKLTLVPDTPAGKQGSKELMATMPVAPLPLADNYPTHSLSERLLQRRQQTAKAMTAPAPVIAVPAAVIAVPTAATEIRVPSSDAATSVLTSGQAEPIHAATERGQTETRAEVATAPPSTPAAYLSNPKPEYPQQAREDREEGLVVLRVLISSEGRPISIQLDKSSGFRALDAAAVSGVKRWSFTPATHNQRAIEAWIDIPIRFRLDQNAE